MSQFQHSKKIPQTQRPTTQVTLHHLARAINGTNTNIDEIKQHLNAMNIAYPTSLHERQLHKLKLHVSELIRQQQHTQTQQHITEWKNKLQEDKTRKTWFKHSKPYTQPPAVMMPTSPGPTSSITKQIQEPHKDWRAFFDQCRTKQPSNKNANTYMHSKMNHFIIK